MEANYFTILWWFPCSSVSKESACNAGNLGSIPGLRRSPGEGNGNPLQYSCLENPHGQRSLADYTAHGVTLWWVFAIHWSESAMGVRVSPLPEPRLQPPSPSHPSGLSQCTGLECPVSHIELRLVIYFTYSNIYVSVLFAQICSSLIIGLASFCELGDILS